MQKFCKGRANLDILKGGGGGGGGSCKQHQGEHWKTMVKISLVILRGRTAAFFFNDGWSK